MVNWGIFEYPETNVPIPIELLKVELTLKLVLFSKPSTDAEVNNKIITVTRRFFLPGS